MVGDEKGEWQGIRKGNGRGLEGNGRGLEGNNLYQGNIVRGK